MDSPRISRPLLHRPAIHARRAANTTTPPGPASAATCYYRNGAGADFTTVTNEWLDANIRSKGPLGKVYPQFMFIMEGDTPSFLGLIDNGLNAYRRPDWGGWGGRYVYRQPYGETHPIWTQGGDEFARVTSQDTVIGVDGKQHISDQATIWRWREAFQNDFAARMDWTIADFAHANHNPIVVVNGQAGTAPIDIDAEVGKPVTLDASHSTDPDGQPALPLVPLRRSRPGRRQHRGCRTQTCAAITIDHNAKHHRHRQQCLPTWWLPLGPPCSGIGTAHIVLAVTDSGSPQLTTYRRIILNVH